MRETYLCHQLEHIQKGADAEAAPQQLRELRVDVHQVAVGRRTNAQLAMAVIHCVCMKKNNHPCETATKEAKKVTKQSVNRCVR